MISDRICIGYIRQYYKIQAAHMYRIMGLSRAKQKRETKRHNPI